MPRRSFCRPCLTMAGVAAAILVFGPGMRVAAVAAASEVRITVDATAGHQRLEGFGQAAPSSLAYPGRPPELSDALRAKAIEAAYHQVGINMGTIGSLLESPGTYDQRRNDNDDPFAINWKGFNAAALDLTKRYLVDLAKPFGFTGYFLGAEAPNVRWGSPWMAEIRARNYGRFLDEAAEQVLANVTYWKNTYGEELAYYQLGNEQQTGNNASSNPNGGGFGGVNPTQQTVDLVKRAGARLRAAGFEKTRFVVGSEETEEASYYVASAVLGDRRAAQYVGAIGYHSYPYHHGYSSVPFILSTSGAGAPDPGRIRIRKQIGDLARAHKVEDWATENSNAGDAFAYDTFRARAIQIHDEFLYANASAYFAMSSLWDEASQRMHFGNTDLSGNEGTVVLIHNATGKVDIAAIGYAIGHYARWAKPGSIRVEAQTSDPLVQVTAFRNDAAGRLALVLLNNANKALTATISLKDATFSGSWEGEQSTPAGYWQRLGSLKAAGPDTLQLSLPATSITSLGGQLVTGGSAP